MTTVAVCETHPLMAEGVRAVLSAREDFNFVGAADSLVAATDLLWRSPADVLIVDHSLEMRPILDWMAVAHESHTGTAIVIWTVSTKESDALEWLRTGARGVLFRTATPERLMACLRSVAEGRRWTECNAFTAATRRHPRSQLTEREHQVRELVAQGLKNREIAERLGIRDGTVKIHLKHIFASSRRPA